MKNSFLLIGLVAACGTDPRFSNRHILWVVHDDAPIPMPKAREVLLYGPGLRDELFRPADKVLALELPHEAANVNALDEVPDSSWFVDPRRDPAREDGRPRPLTDEEMRLGATQGIDPPEPPFVIEKSKTEGATAGFIVRDKKGRKFVLKLDPPGWQRLATSTEVVCTRLVWSLGWRVPAMWLIDLHESDLQLGPKATFKDNYFRAKPMDLERLHEILARIPFDDNGTVPATVSFWIPGKIVGPYSYLGKRDDDPNDRYRHEERRDLRGYAVVSAWINNIDTQELNTLDSYVGAPGRGHLIHYQQDVGGSFGSRAVGPTDYWMGHDYYFPAKNLLLSLITFGAWPRPWEGDAIVRARAHEIGSWPELGYFDADHFDPRKWRPMVFNPAFARATRRDRYWGAKRVAAMTERELRAAISVGGYRSEAAERLFAVLWGRRQKIARAYFGETTSLDYFRVTSGRLCFEDLWLQAGLGGGAEYRVRGGTLDGGCVILPSLAGYRVVTLSVKRPGEREYGAPVKVHLIDGNVVGIER